MKQTILRKYARLIARVGVNIQKGQQAIIFCDLDQPKFVALLVDECYKAGAEKVKVEFSYQPLEKLHTRHQTVATMAKVEEWEKARLQHYVDTLPCRIYLISEDPDGLKGINQAKIARAEQKSCQTLLGSDGEQLSVVHRRRPRGGVGQEALSGTAPRPGHGEALGGHSFHRPGYRGSRGGMGGP